MFLELKTALAKDRKALVGLEYIEINNRDVLQYRCSLCKKSGNLKTIIEHLHTEKHQLEFLRSAFPSVFEAARFDYKKENIGSLLENLCKEVELRLGRLPPTLLLEDTTELMKPPLIEHFKEEPSSTLVIDLIMMVKAKQSRYRRSRSRSPIRFSGSRDRSSSRQQRGDSNRVQRQKYKKLNYSLKPVTVDPISSF